MYWPRLLWLKYNTRSPVFLALWCPISNIILSENDKTQTSWHRSSPLEVTSPGRVRSGSKLLVHVSCSYSSHPALSNILMQMHFRQNQHKTQVGRKVCLFALAQIKLKTPNVSCSTPLAFSNTSQHKVAQLFKRTWSQIHVSFRSGSNKC